MSRILEADLALVEFFTAWCLYSRLLKPKLLSLAEQYAGRVLVTRVDAERESELAALLGIEYVPGVLLLRRGRVEHRWYGDTPMHIMARKLDAYDGHQ